MSSSLRRSSPVYSPLAKDTIRLLRFLPHSTLEDLHCTLEFQSDYYCRPEGNGYTALSYCWGDAKEVTYVHVNGTRFKVTANLWEALSTIFQHHHEIDVRYWIDTICINQEDVAERSEQVYQMWRIYSAADRVFAWLGPEDEDTVKAFETMEYIFGLSKYKHFSSDARVRTRPGSPPSWPIDVPDRLPEWCSIPALRDLLRRPYFSRTWIIQEFTQAKTLIVVCGRCRWYWSTCYVLSAIAENSQASRLLERRRPYSLGHLSHLRDNTSADVKAMIEAAGCAINVIDYILEGYLETSCSEPRDKIFALIGDPLMRSLDPGMQLVPDYTLAPEELSLVFIAYCDRVCTEWDGEHPWAKYPALRSLSAILLSLHRALGTDREPQKLRKFLEDLKSGPDISASRALIFRGVDHCGPLMRTLLDRPSSPSRLRKRTLGSVPNVDIEPRLDESVFKSNCLCPECPYCSVNKTGNNLMTSAIEDG